MKFLILLLIIPLCHAEIVFADMKGEQDTGQSSLPAMSAELLVDCTDGSAIVFVSGKKGGIPDATLFIIRTDSAYRLLNRSETDMDGKGVIGVPGSIRYLNDLYVLRIEKSGYRSKEIQFTFWNCEDVKREYSEYSRPEEAEGNQTLSETPVSPEQNQSQEGGAAAVIIPEAADAVSAPGGPSQPSEHEPPAAGPATCIGFLLPALLLAIKK